MTTQDNEQPTVSADDSAIELQISELRAARVRSGNVSSTKQLGGIDDRKNVLGQQIRDEVTRPGSRFTVRLLRGLAQRLSLEAVLARQDDDLPTLLDVIASHMTADEELLPPGNGGWDVALAAANELRTLGHYTAPQTRRYNIHAALVRLVALGHEFKLSGTGIDPESNGFKTASEQIIRHLSVVGRPNTYANLEARGRAECGYDFGQILYGRNSSNSPRAPSIPFGFLWQLAARLPDAPETDAPSELEWNAAIELSRDLVALVDVETYGQFWMLGWTVSSLSEFLANATLHDHLFSVQQWNVHITPLLIRSFFGNEHDDKLKHKLGWTVSDAAAAVEVLIIATRTSPAELTRAQLQEKLPESVIDALMPDLTHNPPRPNSEYKSPFDAQAADLMFKPFMVGRDGYFVPSKSTVGPACYEAVAAGLRRVLTEDEIAKATGNGLERAIGRLLRFRDLVPTVEGKCYKSTEGQGECDLVLEDDKTVIFIECKAKALTRAAMAGNPQDAVFAYLQGVVTSQAQALQHEMVLKKDKRITFEDGAVLEWKDRDIVRLSVTLFDHGTIQDRFLFGQLAPILSASKLEVDASIKDKGMRRRVKKTNEMLEKLRKFLTDDLGGDEEAAERIWLRALPTASVAFGHLAMYLVDYPSVTALAKVLRKPGTFATGSVMKEYHYLRSQKLI